MSFLSHESLTHFLFQALKCTCTHFEVTKIEKGVTFLHLIALKGNGDSYIQTRITCTITHVTVFYQQIENGNIANQIHGIKIDYHKFILKLDRNTELAQAVDVMMA